MSKTMDKKEIGWLIYSETEYLRDQLDDIQAVQKELMGALGSLIEFIDQFNFAKDVLERMRKSNSS